MLAFMGSTSENIIRREVYVPDEAWNTTNDLNAKLEIVYQYGQNDRQPIKDRCSVSCGDVIELDDKLYVVAVRGFRELSSQEFQNLLVKRA